MLKTVKSYNIPYSLFVNLAVTFAPALAANLGVIMAYYRISLAAGLGRLFLENIYTTGYFILLWLMNFVIFEAVGEIFEQVPEIRYIERSGHRILSILPLGAILIGFLLAMSIPILFKSNFIILIAGEMLYVWMKEKYGGGH